MIFKSAHDPFSAVIKNLAYMLNNVKAVRNYCGLSEIDSDYISVVFIHINGYVFNASTLFARNTTQIRSNCMFIPVL